MKLTVEMADRWAVNIIDWLDESWWAHKMAVWTTLAILPLARLSIVYTFYEWPQKLALAFSLYIAVFCWLRTWELRAK